MSQLLQNEPPHTFPKPAEVIKVNICPVNGLLACSGCPNREEYFIKGTEPKHACNTAEVRQLEEERKSQEKDKILRGISTSR